MNFINHYRHSRCRPIITFICATIFNGILHAQPGVPLNFFGGNGWMPATCGQQANLTLGGKTLDANLGGDVYGGSTSFIVNHKSFIQYMGIKIMRYGGIQQDANFPTTQEYKDFVTFARVRTV